MIGEYINALEIRARWLRWTKEQGYDVWARLDQSRYFNEAVSKPDSWMKALPIYEHCLQNGEAFYMNRQFCRMVDSARSTIPDDLQFESAWMNAPCGFMWLEHPFEVPKEIDMERQAEVASAVDREIGLSDPPLDVKEARDFAPTDLRKIFHSREEMIEELKKTRNALQIVEGHKAKIDIEIEGLKMIRDRAELGIKVSAIGWLPIDGGGFEILCYQDFSLYNENAQGYGCWSYFTLRDGDKIIDRIRQFEAKAKSVGGMYRDTKESDMLHEIRWAYAAFYLMAQRLSIQVQHRIDRNTRRRNEREQIKMPEFFKVVSLRRMEEARPKPKDNGEPIDWQWQWDVVGHWRNQYYPGEGIHKPKWIESYIKGPEDRPMKPPSAKLFVARR